MADDTAYSITLTPPLDEERSVLSVRETLESAIESRGWHVDGDQQWPAEHQIAVKLAADAVVSSLKPGELATLEEQTYRIESVEQGTGTLTSVIASGVLGAAYGLAALTDHISAERDWPPEDVIERPRFVQRMTYLFWNCPPSNEHPYVDVDAVRKTNASLIDMMDESLMNRQTCLQILGTRHLFKWGGVRADTRAETCRELFGELITAAHERRLRVYAMDDEFLYNSDWMESTGATFSVDDLRLWDAIQGKYRDVLDALPELDGIATRVGEVTPKGDILAWDLIHTDDDRSLHGNYSRFLKAIHEVVVGEYNKQYLHRTWMVNTWEQSSVPDIYRRVFTDDVPTENFISSIKITTGDQWEWQPINPTFGQSPHATCAQVETARAQDYFCGSPDFAVEFAQAGLEYALEHGATAAGVNQSVRGDKSLYKAMEYVVWRLAWNPYQSVRELTAEWAASMLGPEIADRVADMLLDFDDIYRDGLHIRGPAYHTWEPLSHLRTGFVCYGNPFLDGGRGHYRYLRDQYLQAKPELDSGLHTMEASTRSFDRWRDSFKRWTKEMSDPSRAEWFTAILDFSREVLHLNLAYVSAFLRFFDFSDAARAGGDSSYRNLASDAVDKLESELEIFRVKRGDSDYVPRFTSADNTQGVEEFLKFARRGLDDLPGLIQTMRDAPDEFGLGELVKAERAIDEQKLTDNPDAPILVTWKGGIDCRDIFRFDLSAESYEHEHYLGDNAFCDNWEIESVPEGDGRPIINLIRGGDRGYVYVMETPTEENGYELVILAEDQHPGYGSYEFEVRWVAD